MLKIINKISVKQWAAIAFVVMLIGIIMPLTASAALFDSIYTEDYTVQGSADITTTEALYAISEYLGVTTDNAAAHLEFAVDTDAKCVKVYENDELVEVVYKNADGAVCGYVTGFAVTIESGTMADIVGDVAAGVGGVFDMSASGFKFITDNNLCMLMVAISLGGVAFGMIAKSFKVSRK